MQTIVKMKYGSHLYGTATPESDKDFKGIFMPDMKDIVLGRIPKSIIENTNKTNEKNTSQDSDVEYYSLHYFIQLALKGETCTIDMLNAPDSAILQGSDIWDNLVENRDKFYSNNMKAFVGYARSQATIYGAKGSRLETSKGVVNILSKHKSWKRLSEIWNELPKESDYIHYKTGKTSPKISVKEIVVCGKIIQETATVEYAKGILDHLIKKYGERARKAEKNQGIDWKAISHAVRISLELQELYETGKIVFPLKRAKLIIQIKKGMHEYKDTALLLDSLMLGIEYLSHQNPQNFPNKPDHKFWEDWLYYTVINQAKRGKL
jgi:hypothetical protein